MDVKGGIGRQGWHDKGRDGIGREGWTGWEGNMIYVNVREKMNNF